MYNGQLIKLVKCRVQPVWNKIELEKENAAKLKEKYVEKTENDTISHCKKMVLKSEERVKFEDTID